MIKYAITGGIATGKSSIINIMRIYGIPVINIDEIAHDIIKTKSNKFNKIINCLGNKFILPNKNINKKKIRNLIFSNKILRYKLENILHEDILIYMKNSINAIEKLGFHEIICEIPLLFEKELQNYFDITILIYTSIEVQIQRLMNRDSISIYDAIKIIKTQIKIEEKRKFVTCIINNDKSINNTCTLIKKYFL